MQNSGRFIAANAYFLRKILHTTKKNVSNIDYFKNPSAYKNTTTNYGPLDDFGGYETMVMDDDKNFPSNSTYVIPNSSAKFEFINASAINYTMRPSLSPRANRTEFIGNDMFYECELEPEPPLLDELEIYPQLIMEKAKIMLNPLQQGREACVKFGAEFDLPGPIMFLLFYACCIVLMGKCVTFQHVYALSLISIFGMYGLLVLMRLDKDDKPITVKCVASVMGYGLVHLLWLAVFGLVFPLKSFFGFVLIAISVYCSTLGTSRVLATTMNQTNRLPLIAFPIALVYCLFALFVIF